MHDGPMAHDEDLAERIRHCLVDVPFTERRMFGGLAFLVDGHMALAANSRGELMVRVDPGQAAELASREGVRPTEMNGRTLTGWLDVDADVLLAQDEVEEWVQVGVDFVRTLPPK